MIWTLLKLGLLMLSYLGYWEFFRRKLKIDVYFAPAFTFAVHFMVMFIPGLLNFLGETVILLYLLGFAALIDVLRKEGLRFLKHYINPGFIVFLTMFGIIAVAVRGAELGNIDDFHHWGTVVKNMLIADQFPTFAQSAIKFGHYPLGSSSLIYYFCRFVGLEEDVQMMAQAFVILSMLLPMYAFIKGNWIINSLFVAVMINFLLAYNIHLTELLVDTLLPMTASASLFFWYHECVRKPTQDLCRNKTRVYLLFPMLLLLINIKISGILFAALILLIVGTYTRRQRENMKPLAGIVLLLIACWILWNRHCDYVYLNADGGSHTVSLYNFQRTISGKTFAEIKNVAWRVFQYVFTRRELWWLLGMAIVTWILSRIGGRPQRKWCGTLLLYIGILYIVYFISLEGMYCFSMPRDEAMELACVDRYIKTVDIAIYMLITAYNIHVISFVEQKKIANLMGALLVLLTLGVWKNISEMQTVFHMKKDLPQRYRVEKLLDEYGVAGGFSYLVCDKSDTAYYSGRVTEYHLNTSGVQHITVTDPAEMGKKGQYFYVVILDEDNPNIQAWVQENYPEQAGERVIRDFG